MAYGEADYLAAKEDRTVEETVRFLRLRLEADQTAPDAKLFIAYREAGAFRRVLAGSLTGADIRNLVDAAISNQPRG
jgi:hypothetical protein